MTGQAGTHTSAAGAGSEEAIRFETIILPLDGSELSESAVPYAVEMARLMNAQLILLRVLEEMRPVFDTACRDMVLIDDANPRLELQSPEFLAPVIARIEHEGIEPRAVVRLGDPGDDILAETGLHPRPLLVMTSHGRGGLGRVLMGSVATRVLRHAPCPVLVVRPRADQPAANKVRFHRIVVPVDGSPLAERALPVAAAVAQTARASVELVRVAETYRDEMPKNVSFPRAVPYQRAALRRFARLEARVRRYLRERASHLQDEGLEATWEQLSGDPARQLLELLEREQPDLIVMTTHGHGLVARWWFGSVADQLLTESRTPIFLIRVREPLTAEFERVIAE